MGAGEGRGVLLAPSRPRQGRGDLHDMHRLSANACAASVVLKLHAAVSRRDAGSRPVPDGAPNPFHGPQVEGKPLPALKRQPKGPRTEGIMLENVKMETITGEAAGGEVVGSGVAASKRGGAVRVSCRARFGALSTGVLTIAPFPPSSLPPAVPYDIVKEGVL